MPTQTIAIAGVAGLGKYLCEELLFDPKFKIVVISRRAHPWATEHGIPVRVTDYSFDSVLSILDETKATTFISLISVWPPEPLQLWTSIHNTIISACMASKSCKRFLPSEFVGDVKRFPQFPGYYKESREPIRERLRDPEVAKQLTWTLFEQGWFTDFLVARGRTHLRTTPADSPFNMDTWSVSIKGTGDEIISWTCAKDTARALVALLKAENWDPFTFISGDWVSLNSCVRKLEQIHGRSLEKSYLSKDDIFRDIEDAKKRGDSTALVLAQTDEWTISGGASCPRDETLRQRESFFKNIKFLTLDEVLEKGEREKFI